MNPEEMTAEEYMRPAPRDEREVALWQCGYSYGVCEGARLGREQLAQEQLAAQHEHAAQWPFPAEAVINRRRARIAREQGRSPDERS